MTSSPCRSYPVARPERVVTISHQRGSWSRQY